MRVCTVARRSQAALVRVLARELHHHVPEAEVLVAVLDSVADEPVDLGPARLVRPETIIGAAEWSTRRGIYGPRSLAGSLVPAFLRHALVEDEVVVHLDLGTVPFGPLGAALADVARRPVTLSRSNPSSAPALEPDLLVRGPLSPAFVGVRRDGVPFLDWWSGRLARGCVERPELGLHYERSWLALAATSFAVGLLPAELTPLEPADLAGRDVAWSVDRGLSVDGTPTSGLLLGADVSPLHPAGSDAVLAAGLLPSRMPQLAALLERHGSALIAAGWAEAAAAPYAWDRATSGLELDEAMRDLLLAAVTHAEQLGAPVPPGPFAPDGGHAFTAWLGAPTDLRGNAAHLSRYVLERHRRERELAARFPDPAGPDGARLRRWATAMLEVPDALLGPPPPVGEAAPSRAALAQGIDVVGLSGVPGSSADRLCEAVRASGLDHAVVPWDVTPATRLCSAAKLTAEAVHEHVLVVLEPDDVRHLDHDLAGLLRPDRRRIAYWQDAPTAATGPALTLLDELWVSSPALAVELSAWTDKPVIHVPLPAHVPPETASSPSGAAPTLGVVADLGRPALGQTSAVRQALEVARRSRSKLSLLLLRADADRLTAEALHREVRRSGGISRERATAGEAVAALGRCDLVLATHPEPELPPALLELVAAGVPVVALEGAEDPRLLTAVLPRDADAQPVETATAALAELLADRARLRRLGVERATLLHRERTAAVTGARVRALLQAETAAQPLPA